MRPMAQVHSGQFMIIQTETQCIPHTAELYILDQNTFYFKRTVLIRMLTNRDREQYWFNTRHV